VRAALDLVPRTFDEVVEELARRKVVVADAAALRTPDFVPALGGRETEELMALLVDAKAAPPTVLRARAALRRRAHPGPWSAPASSCR